MIPKRQHSAALFHNPNEDARMAVHGDDFVRLSDDDGLKRINNLLKSKYTVKGIGTLGFEDSDVKSLLLLNRVFRVGTDQTGQYLDIQLDLRFAPLIISESGCNANTKKVSTPREKLQDKLSDSEERRCGKVQICMCETFIFGPRQIRPCRNRETLSPENERTLWIRLYSIETCSAMSGWETQSGAAISKTRKC